VGQGVKTLILLAGAFTALALAGCTAKEVAAEEPVATKPPPTLEEHQRALQDANMSDEAKRIMGAGGR
jgi:outer membrane lipoprotein-sorting protein